MRRWILATSLALSACAAHADGLQNKWRLEISGNAESAGQIVVQVAPEKGEPICATTQVAAGRAENAVARDIGTALQMVASNRGVAALPRWLVQEYAQRMEVVPVRLGAKGIAKQIHLGVREADTDIDYVHAFIELARHSADMA